MAGHGACRNLILARTEQPALPPVDEVAAVLRGEYIERHHHHPHAERGRQNKIFGLGHHLSIDNLGLRAPSCSVVLEEKLHPTGLEQQASDQSEDGLLGVALDKHTRYYYEESYQSHQKG